MPIAVPVGILGTLILSAQTDLTGFWAFRVPDAGVSYLELKQTGDAVTTVSGGGGRRQTLSGTLANGKLHLVAAPMAGRDNAEVSGGSRLLPRTPDRIVPRTCRSRWTKKFCCMTSKSLLLVSLTRNSLFPYRS